MIRWIENVSWDAVKNGHHSDMGQNAMLIQIADPATFFPVPKHAFKETHQFEFLDADDTDRFPEECLISQEQADEIVRLLKHALDNSMNVLVHCHAGICRSGAVVEVGSMMGFTPTERFRMPNLRVKHFMMKALGLTYDADEKTSWTNGWVSESGIVMPNGDFE
jgi:rhodanese-related sulfurtransferase